MLLWILFALPGASDARAAVAYRSTGTATAAATSASDDSLDLEITKPSGLAVNDVMIAAAQWVLNDANSTTVTASTPSGWTEINNNNAKSWAVELWWKRATAADVSASSFTFTASWTNKKARAAGAIAAYSGVTPTGSPLNWTGDMRPSSAYSSTTIGNGNYGIQRPGDSTPTYTSTAGSLGVAAVMALVYGNGDGTVSFSITDGAAGMLNANVNTTGSGFGGINTAMAYAAPSSSGVYPSTYIGLTSNLGIQWTAFSIVLAPAPACGVSADLTLTSSPSSVSFSTTLDGTNQTLSTSAAFTVDDETTTDGSTNAGWKLTLNASQFTDGTKTLPTTALSVNSASNSDAGSRCVAPTTTVSFPLTLTAGTTTKVYNAAANTGRGPSTITLAMRLAVPANTLSGSYSSTWTYTLASGP
ncbi:MAG: WxL domain-containing protein [Patulibacter sp.]